MKGILGYPLHTVESLDAAELFHIAVVSVLQTLAQAREGLQLIQSGGQCRDSRKSALRHILPFDQEQRFSK